MKNSVSNQTALFVLMTVLLGQVLPNCFNCGKLGLVHHSKHDSLRLCERKLALVLKSSVGMMCSHQGKRCGGGEILSLVLGQFSEVKDTHMKTCCVCLHARAWPWAEFFFKLLKVGKKLFCCQPRACWEENPPHGWYVQMAYAHAESPGRVGRIASGKHLPD